jgi:formate dehydrogenase maturation protein FdhE
MNVEIKNIPDEITEEQFREWVASIIEQYYNQKLNSNPEVISATEKAKKGIDDFRISNLLKSKFEK